MPAASSYMNPNQEARKKAAVLERVGRHREAAHYWHLALADAPDDEAVLCGLAHVYYHLNELGQSEKYVAQALVANPDAERAHRINCVLMLEKGKGAAIQSARRAVELSPTGKHSWSLLTRAYLAAGETEKARESALHLGRLFPSWPNAHLLVAKVAYQMNKYRTAEFYLRSGLALDPELSDAHLLLGQCLLVMNKPQEAASAFLSALKLQPKSKAARCGLLFCVISARRYFRLGLDFIPFAIALVVCLMPVLHFRSWQACVVVFLVFPTFGVIKILKSRQPLSPEVEAAWKAEKANHFGLLALCTRALFAAGKIT